MRLWMWKRMSRDKRSGSRLAVAAGRWSFGRRELTRSCCLASDGELESIGRHTVPLEGTTSRDSPGFHCWVCTCGFEVSRPCGQSLTGASYSGNLRAR
jgi:hypothetical protein